uniref:PilW family protein n=1 Tax=Janthinobacterium sp. TaxID=1871054 RepID=UPI00293D7FEA
MKPSGAAARRRQRGLGVAELLVGLALGLVVTLAGAALLVSTSASYLTQVEAARLDDSGRYALDVIGRALRQSAFVDWDGEAAPPTIGAADAASVAGLDARSLSRAGAGIEAPLAGATNGSDVLAVRFFGAGSGPGGDASVLDCAGFGVGRADTAARRGWSIFYVAADAGGEPELRCKYRGAAGWGADAIVRGVDSFQVLYGIDTDEPADGVANQYLSAGAVDALDAALDPAGADPAARERERQRRSRWKRVVSVKVALLLHGARGARPE